MRKTSRGDASYSAALAQSEFRAIFAASAMQITGTVVSAVVSTVLVFERTRSPLLSSLTFTLGFMPYVFAGTLLSGIVDRVPPRRLLASCSLGCAGLTATMALQRLPVAVLFMLLLGTGTLGGIASASQGALVRSVVPEASYVPARSLMRIASQVAQIAGNPVGDLLLVALSPGGAYLVSSAALVTAALLARFGLSPYPVAGSTDRTALLRDSLRGVRLVFSHVPLRRLLLLGWLVPMFSVAPEALAAPYVAARNGSPALIGWWLSALPLGLVIGDLLGVWWLSPERLRRLAGLAAAASLVPYLAFFASPPITVALPLLVGAGMGSMYSLGLDSLVRRAAPEHLFARTMAVNSAGLLTLQALGFALAGAAARIVGPGPAIAGAGLCGIVIVIWMRPRRNEVSGRTPQTSKADRPARSPMAATEGLCKLRKQSQSNLQPKTSAGAPHTAKGGKRRYPLPGQSHGCAEAVNNAPDRRQPPLRTSPARDGREVGTRHRDAILVCEAERARRALGRAPRGNPRPGCAAS